MSQYVDMDGETLWNPANKAGNLFLRHVRLWEEELGLPSGIGEMANDEIDVAREPFTAFVAALVAHQRATGHGVVLALSEGFAGTVLALADRAGIPLPPATEERPEAREAVQITSAGIVPPPGDARLVALRERMARSMPR
ncbi:DUF6086 family protein [Streptomyces sp. NPDC051921]|uniref:DUF6086 family protein n=1 Tax=Streptomyces sp. NPDC051921 TaxID=3155806 RepID=UPI0034297D66